MAILHKLMLSVACMRKLTDEDVERAGEPYEAGQSLAHHCQPVARERRHHPQGTRPSQHHDQTPQRVGSADRPVMTDIVS